MKRNLKKANVKKWTKLLVLVGSVLTSSALLTAQEKKDEKKKEETKKEESKKEPAAKKEAPKKEGEKKADAKDSKKEESKESAKAVDENALFPEKDIYTRAEVEALKEVLDKKSTQLDQDIDAQVKYLESLRSQTEDHLKKIESARNEIADFMNTRDEKEEGKLKKLARFYEAMDAEQAAPLLKDVQDDLAIKIFDRMDAKKAGTMLAQLPPARAARLTTQFPKLRLQMDKGQAEAQR
jgi:flagellar motility protein MotE (MotC chaperone)